MDRFALRVWAAAAVTVATLVAASLPARAQISAQDLSDRVGIDQRLNDLVPLDASFVDEKGKAVKIGDYLGNKKPILLVLIYYKCPSLCNRILNATLEAIQPIKYTVGREFDIVCVSIDPRETPDVANRKKQSYVRSYGREGSANGWHFLTGTESEIQRLAAATGYRYAYDPKFDIYAHGAGIMLVTPKGHLAQYFLGIEYSPRDLELAITQASEERIGSLVDDIILYCFIWDPSTGKYSLQILRVVQLGAILTVLVLGIGIVRMVRKEKRNPMLPPGPRTDDPSGEKKNA
ncbi:MAG: hypothetical protein AKCLJLPJ_01680 [Fimbriimonadales bacterium]|nr:hypothetical protein [Fimbriimonadales bacterium]